MGNAVGGFRCGVCLGRGCGAGFDETQRHYEGFASSEECYVGHFGHIVVVWVWSSFIKRSGLKPRVQDPNWFYALIVVHNSFLCCLNFYMGWGILSEARRNRYSFWGNPGNDDHAKMGFYIYIFNVSKLYEFMDTVVMLLRRNLRQITFLHLYHHASISFVWWIVSYLQPTGDAALNSWVHVAMYLYYLLAATIAKDEKRRRKNLFWGKYLIRRLDLICASGSL